MKGFQFNEEKRKSKRATNDFQGDFLWAWRSSRGRLLLSDAPLPKLRERLGRAWLVSQPNKHFTLFQVAEVGYDCLGLYLCIKTSETSPFFSPQATLTFCHSRTTGKTPKTTLPATIRTTILTMSSSARGRGGKFQKPKRGGTFGNQASHSFKLLTLLFRRQAL